MNIFITGASGFIGDALTKRCIGDGHNVSVTSRSKENTPQRCTVFYDDNPLWENIFPRVDALFHLAGITNTMVYDREEMLQVNTRWPVKLFQMAINCGVKNIIYASSAAVYGKGDEAFTEESEVKPLNVYGESKALLDEEAMKLAEKYPEVRIVGLRYSNVYGGCGENHKGVCASMVWQLYRTMQLSQPVLFKWGEQRRDWIHVSDIINANINALTAKSGIYNAGCGKVWSFNEVVETINDVLGKKWTIKYKDNPIKQYYQDFNLLDISKAAGFFKPQISLREGILRLGQPTNED